LDFSRVVEGLVNQRGAAQGAQFVLPSVFTNAGREPVSLIAERMQPDARLPAGAIFVGENWFALDSRDASPSEWAGYPGVRFHWAPARHLHVDRALGWSRTAEFRAQGGGSGAGVVVGVVDSGLDLSHPDLRRADGSTRVKWWIDFTLPPAGFHPSLEQGLGCGEDVSRCAVFSQAELQRLLDNEIVGDEPGDNLGHGTHVASLAAGNGRSDPAARYAGIAPEADLIVARVAAAESGISDGKILRAVRFVFERAAELGEPAVVNLSLGSDLGAHDGSSALERALSDFVTPGQPGRAIVVSAGNSAGLAGAANPPYIGPFGVHTEVHVPRESPTIVPIVTPLSGIASQPSSISVWISSRLGDELSIGFERGGKLVGSLATPGSVLEASENGVELSVLNDVGAAPGAIASLISAEFKWEPGESFGVRLAGHGTALLWVTGEGALDSALSEGPLFPQGQREGTINVPASAPGLIAVGATLNRRSWLDFNGQRVAPANNGALGDSAEDSGAFFSSGGPNALGVMKPDLVAPGFQVIGAMAHSADPRRTGGGLFASASYCSDGVPCLVVDDFHAVASGTSMAAPLVSGAVALLFERDPSLTQAQALALLQAGARPLTGAVLVEQQVGVGALDLANALSSQIAEDSPARALPGKASWLAFASSYAHPDPKWPLVAYVELRTDDGQIADGFDDRRLTLSVAGATTVEPLLRVAPGLRRFAFAAPPESGGGHVRVALAFDGAPLTERELPIAVDAGSLLAPPAPRGGCDVARTKTGALPALALTLLLLTVQRRRRKRTHSGYRRADVLKPFSLE
jgi:subtilisin family serine protease